MVLATPTITSGENATRPAYSPLQIHYLERAYTLAQMRREMMASPIDDPLPMRLIGHGLLSAYQACRDLGLGEEVRRILNLS